MIKARIGDDSMSCEMLEILFPTEPLVDHDERGYYFTSPRLDEAEADPEKAVWFAGELLLSHMNGIARIRSSGFTGLKILSYDGIPTRGIITGARAVSWDPHGDHGLEPISASAEFTMAHNDFRVARTLRLLGYEGRRPNWFDLYKIYETVRADLKEANRPSLLGAWVDPTVMSTFTESANRAEVSGDGARHAELGGAPSGRSMTLQAGHELVVNVVKQWLAWKSGQSPTA